MFSNSILQHYDVGGFYALIVETVIRWTCPPLLKITNPEPFLIMELKPGLYELLIDSDVKRSIEQLIDSEIHQIPVDAGDSHDVIASHLSKLIIKALQACKGEKKLEKQSEIYNRIIDVIAPGNPDLLKTLGEEPGQLFEVRSKHAGPFLRADTPLSRSCILSKTKFDPTLESQLRKEISSADEVNILCSFIKWSGLRLLVAALTNFTFEGIKPLRVVTTSYMGVTEPKAIEFLNSLPNTNVKISYDGKHTRLHAKAYIFRRQSGYGTAYIGSSNISNAAMTDGLEWNVKISEYESPHLWEKMIGAFESYWEDGKSFETYSQPSSTKLRDALQFARSAGNGSRSMQSFDLRPYPFQQEILDTLSAERSIQHRKSHLIVAATGTGKTIISAFDYKGFTRSNGPGKTNLLYIAHRKEILEQSLATFRHVLDDQNFGDLCVDGFTPDDRKHVFMSIQTFNSLARNGVSTPRDYYDYIVIDECHHLPAQSYQQLIAYFEPKCLLGLTATPERADGRDILGLFGDHVSAQIRLPDAVNRKLLCPFQYFGISDTVSLETVDWISGGYSQNQLEGLYVTADHASDMRVNLIVKQLTDILLDPYEAKALSFCVTVKHAEYMRDAFDARGFKAACVTGATETLTRSSIKKLLKSGEVNYIFTVDVFNEGVDIPEIDTVLFLRPTESLTVFLQQLGRGLRHSEGKECLTVLDFIGAANKRYRFDARFRALLDDPSRSVAEQVREGFPHLPAGCSIELERIAQKHVLSNIDRNITGTTAGLVMAVRELAGRLKRTPTLAEFLDDVAIEPEGIYRFRISYSELLIRAELLDDFRSEGTDRLTKGLRRLQHISDAGQIEFLLRVFTDSILSEQLVPSEVELRWLTMAIFSILGLEELDIEPLRNIENITKNRVLCGELIELLKYRLDNISTVTPTVLLPFECPLKLHARYTRDELLAGVGNWTLEDKPALREGVRYLNDINTDVFLITLNKTESRYSPTTMYADYARSDTLFHWQSQSRAHDAQPTGKRYINQRTNGTTVLLFVREDTTSNGLTCPYYYLGPADIVSYSGNSPMNIIWKLRNPMPAMLYRKTATLDSG